jgi:hypothetical protein
MSTSNNLIKEFCQSIGMEPLGFDENKQRSLSFDEKVVVTFLQDNDESITALVFIGDLGNPENMRRLLEQNFLAEAHGGGRFALEPNSDRVILTKQWDAVKTSIPEFSDQLEQLVNSCIQCKEFFERGGIDSEAKAKESSGTDSLAAAYQTI